MIQEDKELLLKDLCARLPYGVKLYRTYGECVSLELRSVDVGNDKLVFYTYKGDGLEICDTDTIERFGQLKYKPYLFPLSSMTEEQKEELQKLKWNFDGDDISNSESYYSEHADYVTHLECYSLIDWLNKNHLDYRGLIEKGLAIDATGKNVY